MTEPKAKPEAKPEAKSGATPKPGSAPNAKDDLKTLPMPEVEKILGSSPNGLTEAEAQKRLKQYGPNEIEEKKTNPILKFLSYFWGPSPWMIEAAVILSAVARHWPDFGIILVLLLANAVVGFWEERQAGDAIAALKAKLAINARVKRDGKWVTPPARELVPGDAIRLRLGTHEAVQERPDRLGRRRRQHDVGVANFRYPSVRNKIQPSLPIARRTCGGCHS